MTTFSVVIPTRNEERHLPIVLEAIQEQTLQPAEVVVADGQSIDATREVASKMGVRIVEGGEVATGRNAGAAATNGALIFFLDADVVIADDEFFERAITEFERRRLDIATCDVRIVGGTVFDRLSVRLYNWYVRLWGARHPHPAGFCILVRRNVHEQLGGFDAAIKFAEDHDYGLRARDAGFGFGILNNVTISVTPRRQERDGRLRMTLVYVLAELHIFFWGPITSDIFRYRFGHGNGTDDEK